MKHFFLLLSALIATTTLWASNVITYTATEKLTESQSEWSGGLHTYAFNVAVKNHSFSNGTGTITFVGEVTSINRFAFGDCTSIASITIPEGVTSIGDFAFHNCSTLAYVNIPIGVKNIGYAAFNKCACLSFISIPNTVTSIGVSAFNSTSLISVIIPNNVTSIGETAFFSCKSLTSITIGKSVASLGYQTLGYCTALGSITCYASTPPTCGANCFNYVEKSIPVYVPVGSIDAYKAADGWKDFTNFQAIKSSEYDLVVNISNPQHGSVWGGGTFKKDTTTTIAASAFSGYQFINWSDGNTDNPRTITVTQDSTFTAYFAPYKADTVLIHDTIITHDTTIVEVRDTAYINMIEVNTINPTMGSAVVQIYAIHEEGYQFMYWSDYDTTNPRQIELSDEPQTFTAVFTPNTPTSVHQTVAEYPDHTKILEDENLLILRNGRTYTATGQKLR